MDVHDTEHVAELCGNRRDGTRTRAALEEVLAAAEAAGATTDLVDLGTVDLPAFDPGQSDETLVERVRTLGADLVDYAGIESYSENNTAPTAPTAD